MYIKAIKHIRRLRGGSQAQLMAARTTDTSTSLNSRAIRKPRVYWRTTTWRLARMVGLSVPKAVIIYVDAEIIREYKISIHENRQPVIDFGNIKNMRSGPLQRLLATGTCSR